MSKIKKKTSKQAMRLSVLAASLMMFAPLTHSAQTSFSDKPLVGVSETFAPHVVLALSVEFPTAGAAYSNTNLFSLDPSTPAQNQEYLGYFDNKKCYKYQHNGEGYFYPSSKAQINAVSGEKGLCNNNGETEEFSGNLLNFMTMSAVDIFRSTMTGGNRALGVNKAATEYANGDTPTETYLRRANVQLNQNGNSVYGIQMRSITFNNGSGSDEPPPATQTISENQKQTLYRLVPKDIVDSVLPDVLANESNGDGSQDNSNTTGVYGNVKRKNFKFFDRGVPTIVRTTQNADGTNQSQLTTSYTAGQPAGELDRFSDQNLHFYNNGFTVRIARRATPGYRIRDGLDFYAVMSSQRSPRGLANVGGNDYQYFAIPQDSKFSKWDKNLNVVVKTCDTSNGGALLEENCVKYSQGYKPEGLLQKYTKEKEMRFATMGYLNIAGNSVNGGVLRSRMKNLLNDKDKDSGYGSEWNTQTGQLIVNPDTADASKSSAESGSTISNSGTINYLNKFGDKSGYKSNDPGAELYYTALAYLRGSNIGNAPYQFNFSANADKATAYDGFPAIYDWDDPLTRGIDKKNWQCHQNTIIFLGDTNTHDDRDLPNFNLTGYTSNVSLGSGVDGNSPNDILTGAYLQRIYTDQGVTGENGSAITWETNTGSSNSPSGIAALAYWARVNDIRKDIPGVQNGSNFIIDVAEGNNFKANYNPYYLAAKFGGFTRKNTANDGDTNEPTNKETPVGADNRSTWTDDASGNSTILAFQSAPDNGGTPRNYAVANNPSAMVAALEKAMMAGGAMNNPTQAATGLSVNSGETLDLTNGKAPITLQSTYNFAELSGNVLAYETTFAPNRNEGTLLSTKYKWGAAEFLNAAYHGAGYNQRNLFTMRNNEVLDFRTDSAKIFNGLSIEGSSQDLANYVLGAKDNEGQVYRTRTSLMGTVINSAVMPITAVNRKTAPTQCTYYNNSGNRVENRPTYYAAAANDGALHVMNDKGKPVFGYVPSIAIEKLNQFANRNYTHQYLNDGTPVVTELCLQRNSASRPNAGNNQARTVLLGTTGRGGGSVYALNVTSLPVLPEPPENEPNRVMNTPNVDKNNVVMWEFSQNDDPDLGLTVSKPVVTAAPDGRPLAIVSGGYNNQSGTGYVFILDISKGKGQTWTLGSNYWKIQLGSSGVGAPFVYDEDNDGVGDKIFVGDLEGKLWQINRTSESNAGDWQVAYNRAPLFTPSNPLPITGAPYADTVAGKLMVVVGTGKYFSEQDLNATQQNYAYGFVVGNQPITEDELLQQQITQTPAAGDNVTLDPKRAKVYQVSSNQMEAQHKGWRLTLLAGQNIAADALIREKQAAEFTAARVTDETTAQCSRNASVSYISIDAATGGAHKRPIFDTNGDGEINSDDATGIGVFEMVGIATSQTRAFYAQTSGGPQFIVSGTSGGGSGADGSGGSGNNRSEIRVATFGATKGVRRISWREIF